MDTRIVILLVLVQSLWADVNVMKDVTFGFGEALELCREESHLTEDKMEQFFHIWGDDFKFEDRELGCALQCMSNHFDLLTPASRIHRENTDQFIKSFANGEKLADLLTTTIHNCEHEFDHEEDHCWRIMHIAECVKIRCKEESIAPDLELMMAEFIMEAM